jgi:hypothetical protein
MKLKFPSTYKPDNNSPHTIPCTYRKDSNTGLWKGEDGTYYRLDTHGTKPPHLDLIRKKGNTP